VYLDSIYREFRKIRRLRRRSKYRHFEERDGDVGLEREGVEEWRCGK